MNSIKQIQSAIEALPPDKFRELADWLIELDKKRWNEQFERDMNAVKFDDLAGDAEPHADQSQEL